MLDIFLSALLLTLLASISILHFTEIILHARAIFLLEKPTTKSLDIWPWEKKHTVNIIQE